MELPFSPTKESSDAQLRYIVAKTNELLFEHANGELYDLEIEDTEIWLLNDSQKPGLFVSGLLDVRSGVGRLSDIDQLSRKHLHNCPVVVDSASQAE